MAVYWYYLRNGNQAGPINESTIRQMLTSGQLDWGDFVWNETMPQWSAADQVPELAVSKPVAAPVGAPPPFEPARPVTNQASPSAPVRPAPYNFEPGQAATPASPAASWANGPAAFAPPNALAPANVPTFSAGSEVSTRTVELLTKTRTWVRLLAILGYLCAGFALVGGLMALVTTVRAGIGFGVGSVALFSYILVAGLVAGFATLLNRYSSRITVVQTTRQVQALDHALDAQRLIWKVFGVLALIGVVINALVLIVLFITFATTWVGQSF